MKAEDFYKFEFTAAGYGHYKVKYTTKRGDYYFATINDMELIDKTKSTPADERKIKDLVLLRDSVKNGAHYSKNGNRID